MPQERVAAAERGLVARERDHVLRIQLREEIVEAPTASCRRTAGQPHVLRQKQHRVQMPGQIGAPHGMVVDANPLPQARLAVVHLSALQRDLEGLRLPRLDHFRLNLRERHPGLDGGPVEQMLIRRRERRMSQREIRQGLQQTGLALRIGAHKQNRRRRQVQFQAGISAKMAQAQTSDVHGLDIVTRMR
ncbi:MAG: hypothetical protein BWY25_03234 [Chloroflexi bacterium ADurb.Bin222]|nr:MAG: hypothetical protein BWY25_03234 [Chloroflexi bacterium ADurb.Bin222]